MRFRYPQFSVVAPKEFTALRRIDRKEDVRCFPIKIKVYVGTSGFSKTFYFVYEADDSFPRLYTEIQRELNCNDVFDIFCFCHLDGQFYSSEMIRDDKSLAEAFSIHSIGMSTENPENELPVIVVFDDRDEEDRLVRLFDMSVYRFRNFGQANSEPVDIDYCRNNFVCHEMLPDNFNSKEFGPNAKKQKPKIIIDHSKRAYTVVEAEEAEDWKLGAITIINEFGKHEIVPNVEEGKTPVSLHRIREKQMQIRKVEEEASCVAIIRQRKIIEPGKEKEKSAESSSSIQSPESGPIVEEKSEQVEAEKKKKKKKKKKNKSSPKDS